jgi:hypothetical protein
LIAHIMNKRPIGSFHYEKRLAHKAILCEVRVFLFRVERQLDDWPEESARETRWFDAEEAAELVEEGGLAEIIKGFAGSHVRFVAYEKTFSASTGADCPPQSSRLTVSGLLRTPCLDRGRCADGLAWTASMRRSSARVR